MALSITFSSFPGTGHRRPKCFDAKSGVGLLLVNSVAQRDLAVVQAVVLFITVRTYIRHVLPNIMSILVVQLTLDFSEIVLLETSLSFLGLGVQPPGASPGLTPGEGRNYIATAWWIGIPAGMVIFLTTLSISIPGDWTRDLLDPSAT